MKTALATCPNLNIVSNKLEKYNLYCITSLTDDPFLPGNGISRMSFENISVNFSSNGAWRRMPPRTELKFMYLKEYKIVKLPQNVLRQVFYQLKETVLQ